MVVPTRPSRASGTQGFLYQVEAVKKQCVRWLNNHGYLELPDGKISGPDKNAINKAIRYLIDGGSLGGDKESLWLIQ